MPDRLLKADFGADEKELELSPPALGAYPFLMRAFDNFGCARYNLPIMKAKAFPARTRPTVDEIEKYMHEYLKAELIEIGDGWAYLTRWFRDNRFYGKLRPIAPMPKYMAPHMSEQEWAVSDPVAFDRAALAMGAKKEASAIIPHSPGQSRRVRPNKKQSKAKQSKAKEVATWPHQEDFMKLFKSCWSRKASDEQDRRGKEWCAKYGWDKLKAAMKTIGGDYGFQYVGNVLRGEWNQGRGREGKPGRHHVDED